MKLVWTDQAIEDLVTIRNFIAEESDQNAALVAERTLKIVELIEVQPGIGRMGEISATREIAVPRTPCVLVYEVDGSLIRILAVRHGRQQRP